jgi:hypothetical protein
MKPLVPCANAGCKLNRDGVCRVPNQIRIGQGGQCLTERSLAGDRTRGICLACGLEVERVHLGRWRHIGIELVHDVVLSP